MICNTGWISDKLYTHWDIPTDKIQIQIYTIIKINFAHFAKTTKFAHQKYNNFTHKLRKNKQWDSIRYLFLLRQEVMNTRHSLGRVLSFNYEKSCVDLVRYGLFPLTSLSIRHIYESVTRIVVDEHWRIPSSSRGLSVCLQNNP